MIAPVPKSPLGRYVVPILAFTAADLLTQNKTRRMHWRELHIRQQYLKGLAITSIVKARVPKALGQVEVTVHYAPPTRRAPDADALAATMKPLLDALTFTKRITDDSPAYVLRTSQVVEPPQKPCALWLTITQVQAREAAA